MRKGIQRALSVTLVTAMVMAQQVYAVDESPKEGPDSKTEITQEEQIGQEGIKEEPLEEIQIPPVVEPNESVKGQADTTEPGPDSKTEAVQSKLAVQSKHAVQLTEPLQAFLNYKNEVTVKVPAGFTALSNGSIWAEAVSGGTCSVTVSPNLWIPNCTEWTFTLEGLTLGEAQCKLYGNDVNGLKTELMNFTVVVSPLPENAVIFKDYNLQKGMMKSNGGDIDCNKNGVIEKEELQQVKCIDLAALGNEIPPSRITDLSGLEYAKSLTVLNLNGQSELKDLTPIMNLTILNLDVSCTGIDNLQFLSSMPSLRILTIYGTKVADILPLKQAVGLYDLSIHHMSLVKKADVIEVAKNLPYLRSIDMRGYNLTDQEKLQIMVPDSVCLAKGEKKPFVKDIVGVFDYNVKPVATVEGIHAELVTQLNGESYSVIGKKIGTTNGKVTYQSATISVPIEVTGIDENIPVETGKGNSEFINDADGKGHIYGETIDILRENKELWQVYPEMKKIMSDVNKYVEGSVYEPGFGNGHGANYKHIINGKNELWDGEKKIADHVVDSDYHYALTPEGELKDLFNTKGHSETNVKDWGRKRSVTNSPGYAGTYLLKQDGTLWYRDDVKKEEPINEFVQIDSDVKQLGKMNSNWDIPVEGYLKNTGVFVIEGKESLAGVQEVTSVGVMAADGFYLWDSFQNAFVRVCDFNVKSSFLKGISSDSYDWGLVDTKDQLWRVTIGGAEITESVKLISDQYLKPADLPHQDPFFIGIDGKYYDRDGKVLERDQTKEEYYIGNDQMLCHYGVPILSNTVRTICLMSSYIGPIRKEVKLAIRTDGTVWNVEGIPTLVTNFMIPGVEIPKEKVEAAVQTITTAPSGSEVPVVMEGATEAPKAILEAAKGKDVTVALNMGGYTWEINGKNITAAALQNINLEVKQGTDNIPQGVITETAGTKPVKQLSLTHEGEFGFTATLTVNVGVAYAGQNGTLYYYHGGTLEYVGTQKIDAEGNIQEQFSHASDYAVVIGDMQMLGDVTNDGNINLADLMKVLQSVSGKRILTKEETIAADVNRDTVINLKDLMKILQYVSGKIIKF